MLRARPGQPSTPPPRRPTAPQNGGDTAVSARNPGVGYHRPGAINTEQRQPNYWRVPNFEELNPISTCHQSCSERPDNCSVTRGGRCCAAERWWWPRAPLVSGVPTVVAASELYETRRRHSSAAASQRRRRWRAASPSRSSVTLLIETDVQKSHLRQRKQLRRLPLTQSGVRNAGLVRVRPLHPTGPPLLSREHYRSRACTTQQKPWSVLARTAVDPEGGGRLRGAVPYERGTRSRHCCCSEGGAAARCNPAVTRASSPHPVGAGASAVPCLRCTSQLPPLIAIVCTRLCPPERCGARVGVAYCLGRKS